MSSTPKDPRSAAEQCRDTTGIVGSLRHEGYVPTPEAEAIHQRAARGEITTEEAIELFRQRALERDAELTRKRRPTEQTAGVSVTTQVSLDELLEALEYVSSVGPGTVDAAAYLSRDTGSVYFVGTDMEPEGDAPEDLESSDRYIVVPSKQELDLGKRVALAFAEAHLPEQYERIRAIFSHPRAYARFKALLEERDQLAAWYEFENGAQREALSDWCAAQGFEPA